MPEYAFPQGGLPEQHQDPATNKAIFTTAYAFIPAAVMRDIVTSLLPAWTRSRAWILARPLTGFAETFAQYAVEVQPQGGSSNPEPDSQAQAVLFVANGSAELTIDQQKHPLQAGSYAYLPPQANWSIHNNGHDLLQFHWIRKRYHYLLDQNPPEAFVTSDKAVAAVAMPNTDRWATSHFVDPQDMAHDMHVNLVTFQPGGRIPFAETHVMEHGLYVLQGTAKYLLNTDWIEVAAGDFMCLRAFCPQACITTGTTPFRYLLYKDVNRHPALSLI